MNTSGQVGGVLSPVVLAYIVDRLGDWNLPLHILSCLYVMAAISWLVIQPERRESKSMDSQIA
jgi:nitrate/nitrite transporter NarK